MEKEILARNLTYFRKKSGLSQLELAKKLNYSNKNISKWENGETMPSAFVLAKIAKIYGITIEDLLSEKPIDAKENEASENSKAKLRTKIFKYAFLLLANAIIFSVATILFYGLKMAKVDNFNPALVFLYFSPLSFLSITIFIRVEYKFADIITISLFNWLTILSIYLSLTHVQNMALIFALGGANELIVICICLLVNIKILNRKPKILKLFEKKEESQVNSDVDSLNT